MNEDEAKAQLTVVAQGAACPAALATRTNLDT